ncbi:MAG TPA: ABC-2 family transporter protein [Anaerolineaceae bacterium]|nr:ABC-2 family transporter protein [Anaerolineaceae bacterium]
MLKIFQRLWQVNWAEQWQYRANLIMYLLYGLVSPVVYLSVWRAVANSQNTVKGLTAADFAAYYLTLVIVDKLTQEITIHIFAYKVQDGTLSDDLLRPTHPLLTNGLMYNIAFKVLTLIALAPIWVVLFLAFRPDFSHVTAANLSLATLAVLGGFAINFLLGAIITCIAFWTTRVYSISEFIYAFALLLGGTFVPLDLLPVAVQNVARFLPFQLFIYFPIQLILGRLTPDQIRMDFILQAVWFGLALLAFGWIWRAGLKRYSAVGA